MKEEITFNKIKEANDALVPTDIKGKSYMEVNQRIKAFRMLYPQGTIETQVLSIADGVCIMKAIIKNGDLVLGTGTAYEKENSTFINKTSYIENCETSAVGRALAMCGIGIDTSIASKEEVENAIKQQEENEKAQKEQLQLLVDIKKLMKEKDVASNEVFDCFGKKSDEMSNEELKEVIDWLENK